MLELLLVVASFALADSINPSTLTVGAVYAVGPHARQQLTAFTAGVFGVSLAFGLVVVLGPGELLLAHVPHPSPHTQHVIELIVGAIALAGAVVVWLLRERVQRAANVGQPKRGSALLVGGGLMLAELPTAFPYFAVLAAIITSGDALSIKLALVLFFNVVFVGPLLVAVAAIGLFGERSAPYLRRFDGFLRGNVVRLTCGLLGTVGVVLVTLGGVGLL